MLVYPLRVKEDLQEVVQLLDTDLPLQVAPLAKQRLLL